MLQQYNGRCNVHLPGGGPLARGQLVTSRWGYIDVHTVTGNMIWEVKPKTDYGRRTGFRQISRYIAAGKRPPALKKFGSPLQIGRKIETYYLPHPFDASLRIKVSSARVLRNKYEADVVYYQLVEKQKGRKVRDFQMSPEAYKKAAKWWHAKYDELWTKQTRETLNRMWNRPLTSGEMFILMGPIILLSMGTFQPNMAPVH